MNVLMLIEKKSLSKHTINFLFVDCGYFFVTEDFVGYLMVISIYIYIYPFGNVHSVEAKMAGQMPLMHIPFCWGNEIIGWGCGVKHPLVRYVQGKSGIFVILSYTRLL